MTQWEAGQRGMVSGIPWRIERGRKGPGDLVLMIYANGRWRKPGMDLGFLLADFLSANEGVLFADDETRRVAGTGGSGYYLSQCHYARQHGWQAATQKLIRERLAKCRRLFGGD